MIVAIRGAACEEPDSNCQRLQRSVVVAGIAAIGDYGFGRTLIVGLARIQYRPIQRSTGGIAVFDVEVRDKAVLFGRQVHLVVIVTTYLEPASPTSTACGFAK